MFVKYKQGERGTSKVYCEQCDQMVILFSVFRNLQQWKFAQWQMADQICQSVQNYAKY